MREISKSGFNRFGNMIPPEEKMKYQYLLWREPFQIAGNLYFVGNEWCSSHLIDSGEGLILLDTPCSRALPGLLYSIEKLGFKAQNIKYIIVSHAHFDHYGAVKELVHLTGAKTFISAMDGQDMVKNSQVLREMSQKFGLDEETFVPDVLLEDGDIISLGSTNIRCVLTPGHTIGTMSHFWTVEEKGKTYNVGIYGGAGFITLSKEALKAAGLPLSYQEVFRQSIDKVWNEPVDIMLGNHPFHNDTYLKYKRKCAGQENPFIDPSEWHRFLTELKERYEEFLLKSEEQISRDYARSQWSDYYEV